MSQEPASKMQVLNKGAAVSVDAASSVRSNSPRITSVSDHPLHSKEAPIEHGIESMKLGDKQHKETHGTATPSSHPDAPPAVDPGFRHLTGVHNYCKSGEVKDLLMPGRMLLGVVNQDGDNGLHLAIISNKPGVLKNIFEVVATIRQTRPESFVRIVNLLNKQSQAPVHLAVIQGNIPVLKALLQNFGASPTPRDQYGNNILHLAVEKGANVVVEVVKVIQELLNGNDLLREILAQSRYDNSTTPLEYALKRKDLDSAKFLLSVTQPDRLNVYNTTSGMTPFHLVLYEKLFDIAKIMLEMEGVDVNLKCKEGVAPLQFVKNEEEMKALLKGKGALENIADSSSEEDVSSSDESVEFVDE